MRHRWLWGVALLLGLVSGLAVGAVTAPPPARAALRELDPGLWRAEVGDFTELVAAVAFDADDIWAAGDGIVHFDGAGWRQTLPGQRPFFQAIDGFSSQQLWAAGAIEVTYCDSYGVMYRYDGVAWQAETVETHVPLYDVDMVSATDGWAVGGSENAVIVRYDGTAWRAQVAPEVAGLRAVYAVAADDVWAVGNRGAMAHFDGRDWTAVDGPRFANLTDVHFLDRDFGVAVGGDTSTPTGVVLVYRGGEWSLDSLEELPQLYSVQVLAPAVIVAVGTEGAILFNDGQSWREVGRTYPGGYHAYGWGPALHSLVVLPDRETMIAVGYAGQVVRIEDTLAWTELHTGHELLAIDMLDADYGWIVGSGGRPLRWDGSAWTAPASPASARWLRDVDVLARDDVWAVGRRGTVLHWDGDTWTASPRFSWLDLLAVSFSGPNDGWAVANAFEDEDNPWQSVRESYVFHWDGHEWQQAMRLCSAGLGDIAALGPGDVWFSDPTQSRVLHFDGQGWSWHPVWSYPQADGPASGIRQLAAGSDGTVWGTGYGFGYYENGDYYNYGTILVRLEDGIWRTQPRVPGLDRLNAIAGATTDGLWGITRRYELVYVGQGQVTAILALGQAMQRLSVVPGADGAPNAWLIGPATTVLHYRAPSASRPEPLVTVTAPLPPPVFHPTPTPYSVYDRDEALARILTLADPEDTGDVRLDSLTLVSVATWQRERRREYLDYPYDGEGPYPWHSEGRGSLSTCWRGADLPVWVAEFSVSPVCISHVLVALDATGRDAWQLLCYPRRLATLFLPMVLRPRDGGAVEPTATPVQNTRDLTPEPVVDIHGACPTSTPWPDDPGGGYPGPEE